MVLVEMDSSAAVGMIQRGCSNSHPNFEVIRQVQALLGGDERFSISQIPREANWVADSFAKVGLNGAGECRIYERIPSFVSALFQADLDGIMILRDL